MEGLELGRGDRRGRDEEAGDWVTRLTDESRAVAETPLGTDYLHPGGQRPPPGLDDDKTIGTSPDQPDERGMVSLGAGEDVREFAKELLTDAGISETDAQDLVAESFGDATSGSRRSFEMLLDGD